MTISPPPGQSYHVVKLLLWVKKVGQNKSQNVQIKELKR